MGRNGSIVLVSWALCGLARLLWKCCHLIFVCYLGLSDGVRRLMIEDIDMMSLSIQLMFVRCVSMEGEREA